MKSPKFTDQQRFPYGYTSAAATDISKTFARIQAEQKRSKNGASSVVSIKGRK